MSPAKKRDMLPDSALDWEWKLVDDDETSAVWVVSVTITNTGKVSAQEIVQIYVKDPNNLPVNCFAPLS
eukprot:SAG31_NODE_14498_length_803_cov_1.161932_2_plen_69_part_00